MSTLDENREYKALVVDENGDIASLLVDPSTGRLLIDIEIVTSSGTEVLNNPDIDENHEYVALAVTDDANLTPTPLHVDSRNGYLYCDILEE